MPLVTCERLVLVGDQKQLAPQLASNAARRLGLGESLFARLVRLGAPSCFLDVQYRMHPALCAFPATAFYGGRLKNGVSAVQRPVPGEEYCLSPVLLTCVAL